MQQSQIQQPIKTTAIAIAAALALILPLAAAGKPNIVYIIADDLGYGDLAGVDAPDGLHGISFLPTLTGKDEQPAHDFLYWEFHELGTRRALRQGDWKLLQHDMEKTANPNSSTSNATSEKPTTSPNKNPHAWQKCS